MLKGFLKSVPLINLLDGLKNSGVKTKNKQKDTKKVKVLPILN